MRADVTEGLQPGAILPSQCQPTGDTFPFSSPAPLPGHAAWLGVAPQRECLYPENLSGPGHPGSLLRLPVGRAVTHEIGTARTGKGSQSLDSYPTYISQIQKSVEENESHVLPANFL